MQISQYSHTFVKIGKPITMMLQIEDENESEQVQVSSNIDGSFSG